MQRLLVGCAASALFAATIGLGAGAVLAQEGTGAMGAHGESPDRPATSSSTRPGPR